MLDWEAGLAAPAPVNIIYNYFTNSTSPGRQV